MAVCVVVLKNCETVESLQKQLKIRDFKVIQTKSIAPTTGEFEEVELLNPATTRKRRQRMMASWLMPFGFMAGVIFTFITDLKTFSYFGQLGEILIGGLLGMGSGFMGSYAGAASVNSENENGVRILQNRSKEGSWLLLIETPLGVEIPWQVIQNSRPLQVVRLSEL